MTAPDHEGLGLGVGYAFTEDNRCLLAHRVEQVNGRLAAQLGADTPVRTADASVELTALGSDLFYRGYFDMEVIRAGFEAGAAPVRDLARGYAAGVNRYRAEHPDLPPCEVDFQGDVTEDDMYRMWVATAALASGEMLSPFVVAAAPPGAPKSKPLSSGLPSLDAPSFPHLAGPFGSNAWALGRNATQDGHGLHLYNPHFPWSGAQRLYVIHLTIPGKLDVMGAALGGFPVPLAGFNRHVAWGLTFSTAARYTLSQLALVEGDPRKYTVDGEVLEIKEEPIEIAVAGEDAPRVVPFYRSADGPIVAAPAFGLGWTQGRAFAVHDVNADNTRVVQQFLELAEAGSIDHVRDALAMTRGVPWSYTLAVDDAGDVLFGDLSSAPNVPTELIEACGDSPFAQSLRPFGVFVLDGSKGECRWEGPMPPEGLPVAQRTDYLANSNNTYEAPHHDERVHWASLIFGPCEEPLSLRAGVSLDMITRRIEGSDGLGAPMFTPELALEVFQGERNRAAELLVAEIVADCEANPLGTWGGVDVDLTETCAALGAWDRRNTVESRGAHVFAGMWTALTEAGVADELFLVPATLAEPLTTPAGYTEDAAAREKVRAALARVTLALGDAGIAPDARWGDVNVVDAGGARFGVPGGQGREGVFDSISGEEALSSFNGWSASLGGVAPESLYGASYLHLVDLGPDGPAAKGLLTYSQATEPASPWYRDQLGAYAAGEWFDLPFSEDQIAVDPGLSDVVELDPATP
ncbi:MAG: penicillin acylase family protein [Polyangiaceae bacterium]|nr:penicillin acylase family protein [Polyangiaceae bacterium]